MSGLSNFALVTFKGLTAIGAFSAMTIGAAPAFAYPENGSISGAMTRVTPSGFVTSVAGQMVAPGGMFFNQPLTVNGVIEDCNCGSAISEGRLIIDAGAPLPIRTVYGDNALPTTLKETVISTLNRLDLDDRSDREAYAAIVKAAAGFDGLE
ncbi:MAG: hypothetical protein KME18_11940 [Phormidium tanganyikae FI6-MK23]|jgi:hypothetical protein|nr:hypothetical protein [Phormidium tanganyikae FI6-MK23]